MDAAGCPIDTDLDGIADFEDVCPQSVGTIAAKGCPDTDGDGFTDAQDNCPTIKGEPKFFGCPDTDMDGVADMEDKCANTPKSAQLDRSGCPLDECGL